MTTDGPPAWADAVRAAELFAVDPLGIGGVRLCSQAGPVRELWLATLRACLREDAPMARMPAHISEDRLLGGLDLAATLRSGRIVAERGLLSTTDGGVVVAAMAERLSSSITAQLCSVLDQGKVVLERDGITRELPARVGVVALDEGIEDERTPVALVDRLGIQLVLDGISARELPEVAADRARLEAARARMAQVAVPDDCVEALCAAALALGIDSLRAPLQALAVARASAALAGRSVVADEDAEAAARLVFAPRATRVPPPAEQEAGEPEPEQEEEDRDPEAEEEDTPDEDDREQEPGDGIPLEDLVLAAAAAAIPSGLLATLQAAPGPRSSARSSGRAGALQSSGLRGRPSGVRQGMPGAGHRLNVVETLRAAAPWQTIRRRARGAAKTSRRLEVRAEDFRITWFKERSETTTIFAVDASGSSALQRLAEAKGAVEQLLADCYVRRDNVALLSFRGAEAQLLLPPTKSLVRAKRSLAELPGGGATPLAAGLAAALAVALDARKRGQTPVVVVMTDGRANVARDGSQDRPRAEADALTAARLLRTSGIRALFVDTAPRPRPAAQRVAEAMGARYLPLPNADGARISREVQAIAEADAR